MSGDRVSVVMPVRNGARWIGEALESIVGQTRPAFEILVADDVSTDWTADVARRFPGVRVIPTRGAGAAAAMNVGILESSGDLVALMSHDDRWELRKLERQVPFLLGHPEAAASIGHFRYFLEEGCSIPVGINPSLLGRELVGRIPETLLARRDAFTGLPGLFPEGIKVGYDMDWFARLIESKRPLVILPECLLHKRLHGTNASNDALVGTRHMFDILRGSISRRRGGEAPQ